MDGGEDAEFPQKQAVEAQVSASTQNQALSALLFLFRSNDVVMEGRIDAVRGKIKKRLPVVLVRRHHVHESQLQKTLAKAAKTVGIAKHVRLHTLRHRLPPICWRTGRMFAQCRICWGTRAWIPR